MGSVYRKSFTKPVPNGAETFTRGGEQHARWRDAKGKARTARVTTGKDGTPRLLIQASTYTVKYRDGSGIVCRVGTGCRDKSAALAVLHDLERRSEKVKAGVMTAEDDAAADQVTRPIEAQVQEYGEHLRLKGVTSGYAAAQHSYIMRAAEACGIRALRDLNREKLETWLSSQVRDHGMGHKTHNAIRGALVTFCRWCVRTRRLTVNPLEGIVTQSVKLDPRRQRRALTVAEAERLLRAAQERPLARRQGQELTPASITKFQRAGVQRSVFYGLLLFTGLRFNEARTLVVADLVLDPERPRIILRAKNEKAKRGAVLYLRDDVRLSLETWLGERLRMAQDRAKALGESIPTSLPPDALVFDLPKAMTKRFNEDLAYAGIPKRDARGMTADIHSLRTTFCSWLMASGTSLRVAQQAMRHSTPALTAGTYTDPAVLDVAGAVDGLPGLELPRSALVPTLVPTSAISRHKVVIPDSLRIDNVVRYVPDSLPTETPIFTGEFSDCQRVAVNEGWSGRADLNRRPLGPEPSALNSQPTDQQWLTHATNSAGTGAGTSFQKAVHETDLDALAAALRNLDPDARQALARMLSDTTDDGGRKQVAG